MAFCSTFILHPSSLFLNASSAETGKEQMVEFNFVDVELSAVTKFISEITGKNFIFDERVKGKITIIAPTKLNIDDAYNLFTSILELKGFTLVPSGVDVYKIIPVSEAKQKGLSVARDKQPVDESYIARLITLKNISSNDALKLLQPIVSRYGLVSSFGPGNLLLIIDSGLNIEKILSIIETIDQPSLREEPEIVYLEYASADVVVKILNKGIGRSKKGVKGRSAQADEAMAVAAQRLNAVILFGDKRLKDSMKSLIIALDVPSPEAHGRINVYFLENADATELAKVLEGIIKGAQPQRQTAKVAARVTPFEGAGGITITADVATNALIIVASPADYQNLIHVIKQLDKRRRQVFVEAMIVEVSIDKLRELGTKFRVIGRHKGEPIGIGGFGTIDPFALQSLIYGMTGLALGGMGNFLDIPVSTIDTDTGEVTQTTLNVPGFAALFSLNEFKGTINILSTPQLLTSDNMEAEIVVGENVPFISKIERGLTTGDQSPFSSIVRQDVGITLRITPQITKGDYVKLDIYQEISSVKQESENIIISVGPTTTKRSTKTSVVVKDGQTVIIGGLMQETEEVNITKVPFLGDIPILGWLFRNKSVSMKKTNLLVFITPHVVKDAEALGQITRDKQKEFAKAEKQYAGGELLIKFKEGVTDEIAQQIISDNDASVIKIIKGIGVYHLKLRKGQDVEDAVKEFSSMPEVEYAEPNYRMRIQ